MKILVVCQHFYPEQFRINDICFSLAKRGHDVTVLTGLPNYPKGKVFPEYRYHKNREQLINGVKIIRCSLIGRGSNPITFGINYAWFAISGKLKARTLNDKYDLVYSYQTSPISMVWPAITVKKKQHIPLVINCLDQWPISVTTGPISKKSLFYKWLYRISVNTYKKADLITITSRSYEEYFNNELHLSTEKYGLVYWPQYAEDIYQKTTFTNNGTFDLLFAGNIGPASSVETIINAAVILKNEKNIKFHIVGDGMNREICEKIAKDNGLSNVTFYGYHPVNEMQQYFDLADTFLITMVNNEVVNRTLPAKMQSYMLAKKPILGAINGEANTCITSAECGLSVNSGDSEGLANIILKASKQPNIWKTWGNNGYNYYENHFAKEELLNQLEEILSKMV